MTDLPADDKRSVELRYQAHEDLSRRARGGIIIYLLGWLALTLPVNVHETHTFFFTVNTGILLVIMAVRLYHLLILPASGPAEVRLARNWLITAILAGAAHWGATTAWVLMQPDLDHLAFTMVASAAVLGIAGTTALGIAPELRRCFAPVMLAPVILALLWRGTTVDAILATMTFLALAYGMVTATTASSDYWRALTNQLTAQDHAAEMEKLSVTDPLTQLKNRGYFDTRFREEWKRGERQQLPLSVLMLDLDKFKLLNDTYGHAFGDEVLRQVSTVLEREVFREFDLVARYGGEEFVVLLPNADADAASLVAERIRTGVEAMQLDHLGRVVPVTCSIGGATVLPDRETNAESLLKRADDALYESKENGRNRYTAAGESSGRTDAA